MNNKLMKNLNVQSELRELSVFFFLLYEIKSANQILEIASCSPFQSVDRYASWFYCMLTCFIGLLLLASLLPKL